MRHPSWLTKPPCFDRGLSAEGNKCFGSALAERGLSCVAALPGGTGGGGGGGLVGRVIMTIPPSRGTQDLCCPRDSKSAPGPATVSSSGSALSLGKRCTRRTGPSQADRRGRTTQRHTCCQATGLCLGISLPPPALPPSRPCHRHHHHI